MRAGALAAIAALIGFVNFFVFFCVALRLGGDAANGKAAAGHYFLASHGVYTKVSKAVYTYSLWHVYSLILTSPLAFGGMAYLALKSMAVMNPGGRPKF